MKGIEQLLQEIKQMTDASQLTQEQSSRLMLVALLQIGQALEAIQVQNSHSAKRLEMIEEHIKTYPSLTWLLRHETKKTVAFIVAAFIVLSLWFVSELRQPILQLLGLPLP